MNALVLSSEWYEYLFLVFPFHPFLLQFHKRAKDTFTCVCVHECVCACMFGEFTLGVVHVHLRYCSLETIQPFSLFYLCLIVCLRQLSLV